MAQDQLSRVDVVLSIQGALLGSVTPNIRGVGADWNSELLQVYCYYDGEIFDSDKDSMSVVETEIMTDFLDRISVTVSLIRLESPFRLPDCKAWIYLRKEDTQ